MRYAVASFRKRLLTSVRIAPVALLGGVALGALPVDLGSAEEAKVEDVVVSGGASGEGSPNKLTRQEERVLIKTPRSGGVVNGAKAEEQHLERLSDFTQLVPNYNPNIGNPRTSKPAIRGIGAGAGTGDGSESDTGFIVDNVFYKHIGFQWGDFVDIDSFEVALGPQGTLGGKNTTVGNIVIKTQLPSFTPKAVIETSYGNYSHIIEKGNITGPVIDEKLAYRLSYYLDKGDGWIHDQVTGAGLLNNNRWGVRGQLLFTGEAVTDRLIVNYGTSHEYNNSNSGVFGDSFLLYANGTMAKTYGQTLQSRLGKQLLSIDPYTQLLTHTGTLDERQVEVSNEVNWQIGDNTLTAISGFGEFRLLPRNSEGGQETAISDGHSNTYVDQYSQEVRLASPKDQPLEWTTGVFAFYDHINSTSQTIYGPDAARWYGTATTSPALMNGTNYNNTGKERTANFAGYGNATYHVDEKLALNLGLRDGWEFKEGSSFGWIGDLNQGFTLQQVLNAFAGANSKATYFDTGGVSKSRNMLTGIFNPSYKITDDVMLYTLVGRGEKAYAVNTNVLPLFDATNLQFKAFQPTLTKAEYNWDYEVGAKTTWLDKKLVVSSNLYWTDIFNFQTNISNNSLTNANGAPLASTYLGTAPHILLRGWEFATRYTPIDRLWLTASGAYTDARWISFPNSPAPGDWGWTTNVPTPFGKVSAPTQLSLSNTRFTGLPKWAFNIGANYEQPVGKLLEQAGSDVWKDQSFTAFGYANLAFWDRTQFTNPWSLLQYWQPAYTIVNSGVGLRTDDKRYSVEIWVKNLFDTRYIQPNGSWSQGNATTPATYSIQAQPRYWGATFRVEL